MNLYSTLMIACISCANPILAQQKAMELKASQFINLTVNTFSKEKGTVLQHLPAAFYTQHLPFFCRQELKLEHTLHTPIRIRAGSIDACNYLEQKPGYQHINR